MIMKELGIRKLYISNLTKEFKKNVCNFVVVGKQYC